MGFDLDDLRRRMMVGAAAICGLVYLLLLRFKLEEPSDECLVGLFIGWLFLLVIWLSREIS